MNIAVNETTYRLLEKSAKREARSVESIVDDAVRLYEELHSDAYKQHLDAAHRFRTSPPGSDEREIAGDELARASARSRGIKVAERGGSLGSAMAQIRRSRSEQDPS